MKILYVEDESTIRTVLSAMLLRKFGVGTVDDYNNGLDAFQAFNENVYDIIITDVYMPKMTGIELAKKVRQHSTIPIIFNTGDPSEKDLYEIDNSYIYPKPIDKNDLYTKIEKLLGI
jgi:CheY-like chemotaxis protein